MPRTSKQRRFQLRMAREARRLTQHNKDQLVSLHLEAPVQLDFEHSTVPPLNIESSSILGDDEASTSTVVNTNCETSANKGYKLTIDKNKSQSSFPSCLICHDRYVQDKQDSAPAAAAAFVSRLPSSVAPAFTSALGQLILSTTNLSSSESQALLSQMEKALYCSNCMKQLREIAVVTEQFDKLNYWLGVRRVQMIMQLQNPNVEPKSYYGNVGGLRAKLIKNLQAPCYLKASEIITKTKTSMEKTNAKQPTSKALKRTYPVPADVAMTNKTTLQTYLGKRARGERRGRKKKQEVEEEIWEHVQVKVENEEDAEEDVAIMDQDDDAMDPLDPGHEPPESESMLTNSDDDDDDVKMSSPLVNITTPAPPPPQQQQPTQILLIHVVKCTVCTELFMNQAQLDEHLETEHPPPTPPLLPCKCNLCGSMCNYKSILNHLKTVHYKKEDPGHEKQDEASSQAHQHPITTPTSNDDDDDDNVEDDDDDDDVGNEDSDSGGKDHQELLSQCSECGKHVKDLPFHTFLHSTSFSCDACPTPSSSSSSFTSYYGYRLHLTTAHPELGSHTCEDCGRTFINLPSLRQHKSRKHNQDFQHPCSRCLQRFRIESELQTHVQFAHDKTCSICDAKFSTSGGFKRHLAGHANKVERKYKCDECSKSFTQPGKLKNHVAAIHGVNKEAHVCEVCGKGFPIHNYLYIHLRSHETPEEKEARRLKAKAAAEARKLSGKPMLVSKGRPRIRPIKAKKLDNSSIL